LTNNLIVRDHMTRELFTIAPSTEIMRAAHLLVEHDISGVPVVDAENRLIGILTERDCIAVAASAGYFDEAGGSVSEYMSSPVHTAAASDSLVDLANRFAQSQYRRYPVLEDGQLVGLISRRDVLQALTSESWFGQPRAR